MNTLTTNSTLIDSLPEATKKIALSPKISEVPNLESIIRQLYNFAAEYTGIKGSITEDKLNKAVHYSTLDIQHQFPYLRVEEIKTAVNNGVRGVYGDNYGLNAATFNKWLVNYIQQTREDLMRPYIDVIKQINQAKTDELFAEKERKLQEDMKSKHNLQSVKEMTLQLYKKNRIIMYGGGELYRSLVASGEIVDNWEQYINKVAQWAKNEKLKRMSNGQKHNDLTEVLQAIQSNAIDKVQLQCRQMILQEWIERQICTIK